MKYYDVITKRGNTYRVDEPEYNQILQNMSAGKMFVRVNGIPVNVSNIAEIPPAKMTEVELVDRQHQLAEGERKPVDENSPGYRAFKAAKEKLIKRKGIS